MSKPAKVRLTSALETGHVCACFNLRKASRAITQYYDNALRPTGLRATQFTLLTALRVRSPISVHELAERLGMDRTTLTRNLKPLERSDWVEIMSGADKRVREVSITPAGHKILAEAYPQWRRAQERIVDEMGDKRFETLLSDLGTAIEATEGG